MTVSASLIGWLGPANCPSMSGTECSLTMPSMLVAFEMSETDPGTGGPVPTKAGMMGTTWGENANIAEVD